MKCQKSVSPIIATILLIVVAVLITTVILSWGRDFVGKNTDSVDDSVDFSCMGADLKIISCSYNSDSVEILIIVNNSGKVDFTTRNEFYGLLVDKDETAVTKSNFLDSNSLVMGQSINGTIDVTNLVTPISLKISSSECPLVDARAICR